ncbi:MAG: glucose-6-phosphate isomerase, partial [Planctomycetota bacterium]
MTERNQVSIAYDYSGLLVADTADRLERETGLARSDLDWLAPRLENCRQEVLGDSELWKGGGMVPEDKIPLDAGFFDLPDRMLRERRGELDQIVAAANRLAKDCDRVVVLGIGGSYMGARAMFEACCHPYHNEVPRQRRGGRPRLYFEGNNVDNDSVQGLLDLLEGEKDWAIMVISKSGGTLETAAAFRIFLECLRRSLGDDAKLKDRVVAITGEKGGLRELSKALGCRDVFAIPEGVGGRFSVLSPVGLLPGALLGLDIVGMLEGAAAINDSFGKRSPLEDPSLAYAGVSR